jgi:mono/diheme cytochrome c family protein
MIFALLMAFCAGCSETASDPGQRSSAASDDPEPVAEEQKLTVAVRPEPPSPYREMTNPYAADDAERIDAGFRRFKTLCARCHGPSADGNSPVGKALDPPAGNLTDPKVMNHVTDGYLYWRISEGGDFEPFNSSMIPWGEDLSEEDRWNIILWIRSLQNQ